jgi:secreted PhoX family phosphatase
MTQGSTPENLRGGSSRRDFLKLSSGVTLLPAVLPVFGPLAGSTAVFASAQAAPGSQGGLPPHAGRGLASRRKAFEPLAYSNVDAVSLAKGFEWYAIASAGDVINAQGDRFGDCCDFTAFFEGEEGPDHGYLWVNHEYVITNVLHGRKVGASEKTREMVDAEMKLVGGSLLEIRRDKGNSGGRDPGKGNAKSAGQWKLVANSKKAFRVDANTDMPLVGPAAGIAKGQMVKGTMGNCGGGFTPWRTALSGEENVDIYYGKEPKGFNYGWGRYYDRPEEHYGWVVEVDIDSAQARKLTSLGRFAHEGATFVKAKDGRAVVYMGDDAAGRCVYKFISKGRISGRKEADKDLLLEGDLFVADLKGGKWVLLAPANEKLAADKEGRFKTLEAILVNTREAAKVAGGTPLNRPEDVKVHPLTGVVHFTLTNNAASGDFHGEVVALEEEGGDAGALRFVYDTYIAGGRKQGFSCPDNLVFGPEHSLWVCTDISDSAMGRGAHADFPRNSMLRVEADTKTGATVARHFLQSPRDAEITGPSFTPDFKTLFVAIQHPGESSFEDDKGYTSHWPDGGSAKPRSTLIGVKETSGRFA